MKKTRDYKNKLKTRIGRGNMEGNEWNLGVGAPVFQNNISNLKNGSKIMNLMATNLI